METFVSILRKPFEYVGLLSEPEWEITSEEQELLRRLHDRFSIEPSAFLERKGFVTQVSSNSIELGHRWNYTLLEHDFFSVGDYVSWKEYKMENEIVIKDVIRVNEKALFVTQSVSSEIVSVEDENKFVTNSGVIFYLDKVRCDLEFRPVISDFVMMECEYPKEKEGDGEFEADPSLMVVRRVTPANSKLVTGKITSWNPITKTGVIGGDVMFHQNACDKLVPVIGINVVGSVIGGRYQDGTFKWRAYHVVNHDFQVPPKKQLFSVAPIPPFQVVLGETKTVDLNISNHSEGKPCIVTSLKIFIDRNLFSCIDEVTQIPLETTITWPVKVLGDRLGKRQMKMEWRIKGLRFPIHTYITFFVVQQDLGSSAPARVESRIVIPGPRSTKTPIFRKVPMKSYHIPEILRTVCVEDDRELIGSMTDARIMLQRERPVMGQGLCPETYAEWMHTCLFLEEIVLERAYAKLTTRASLYLSRKYVVFNFAADSEYSKVVCGDSVMASLPWESMKYEGKVWAVTSTQKYLKFSSEFENSIKSGALYDLEFKMSRAPMVKRHHAIDLVVKNLGADWLFPSTAPHQETIISCPVKWINDDLNFEQRTAVTNILAKKNLPNPYIIYGPPGTGKTMTVVEAILQICLLEPDSRILVTAPSNSAVDTLGLRILEFGVIDKTSMLRLSGYNAYTQGLIAVELMDISKVPNLGDAAIESPLKDDSIPIPTIFVNDIVKYKITIGTLTTISYLNSAGLPNGYFTHIIIDEAAQCHEPDSLIPIALVQQMKTQLVLAGDPAQLGPTSLSILAQQYSFQRSLLDRLSSAYMYRKKVDDFQRTNGYNPLVIARLMSNYRSLPKIVDLIGRVFYEGDLRPTISTEDSREGLVLKNITIHGQELRNTMNSLIFINVNTPDEQIETSMSWFNNGEVAQVWLVLSFLTKVGISPDSIGVITPYNLQVKKIYEFLDNVGAISPKVASVEEFQGQERDVIILSLVRNNYGSKKISPFICDRQRINVALSRSKVLNVIIGNYASLSSNPMWKDILSSCLVMNPSTVSDSTP